MARSGLYELRSDDFNSRPVYINYAKQRALVYLGPGGNGWGITSSSYFDGKQVRVSISLSTEGRPN